MNASNMNLHRKLKRILAEDGTILFIGSGISMWSGLPSWGQLLDEMADFVELRGGDATNIRYFSNSKPLLAADLGCKALGDDGLKLFIQSACRKGVAKPSIVHQFLVDLGVSCYITTNYDQLLEQALKDNGLLKRFKVITNREPMECAGLLPLNKRNFIFKPHGDMEQIESIILSERQYNDLYENGNKFYTSRALETLLTTRNVVFVGFGLTDPDFIKIMGKIRNEFHTNLCMHYAIMPDVPQIMKEYWYENYGLEILSYETRITENGRDYSALLEMLGSLATQNRKPIKPKVVVQDEKKFRITKKHRQGLNRYVKYVIQNLRIPDGPIIPLMIKKSNKYERNYKYISVEDILTSDIKNFILTGNPGAGKTFFLKRYCIAQVKYLQEWCESEGRGKLPQIPIYIDLKNYCGKDSINNLIRDQFPEEIPIMEWVKEGKVFLLFDSFNEVERTYIENGSCIREIREYSYSCDIVIATRFKDILDIHLQEYQLEEVKEEYVVGYLENQGIEISYNQEERVINLLQTPFIFHLLLQGKIKIDNDTTPKKIYESYFKYLRIRIQQVLNLKIDITFIFSSFAYHIFENGIESFSLEEIEELLDRKAVELKTKEKVALINWLIDVEHFLVPTSPNSLSFFHQSITEFLAAYFFAHRFKMNPEILNENLQYLQWNYVLLFAVEFLDKKQAKEYMDVLLQTDSLLAVKVCSYLEKSSNQIILFILQYLLEKLPEKGFDYCFELAEAMKKLPVNRMHQELLRKLMEDKDSVGGAAADCLLRACGDDVKNELLEEMFQNCTRDKYNYVNSIGESLSEKISLEDYKTVVLRLGQIEKTQEEESLSLGFDHLAQYLPLKQVVESFQPVYHLNVFQRQVLVDILLNSKSQEGFDICLNLISQGWKEAIFPLYMYVRFNNNINLINIDEFLIENLISKLQGEDCKWVANLIYELYQKSQTFARGIRARLRQSHGIVKLIYYYAIGKNRKKSFLSLYSSMLYFNKLPAEFIGAFDEVDWKEEADHIIEFLLYQNRLNDLGDFLMQSFDKTRWHHLSISTLLKLVMAMETIEQRDIDDEKYIKYQVGDFISQHVDKEDILNLYHISNEKVQRFFNFFVLNRVEALKLEDFSETEICTMLEDIKHYSYEEDIVYDDKILLANISSEEFAINILKPFLNIKNVCLEKNVKTILEKVGENHLKRYIER